VITAAANVAIATGARAVPPSTIVASPAAKKARRHVTKSERDSPCRLAVADT
jgi:hypothetical protein